LIRFCSNVGKQKSLAISGTKKLDFDKYTMECMIQPHYLVEILQQIGGRGYDLTEKL